MMMVTEQMLSELTTRFYQLADADPILGPILAETLPPERRAEHFQVFTAFWSRFLLGSNHYTGNAFQAHAGLTLDAKHFERWLEIFAEVAASLLPDEVAAKALAQARHMSSCLQGRPGHHHGHQIAWPLGRAVKTATAPA